MTDEFDYEEDLAIDPHNLDEEVLHQPLFYSKYSKLRNIAKLDADNAKLDVDLACSEAKEEISAKAAEINLDIRDNPDKYGLRKVTENVVEAALNHNPEYKKLVSGWSKLKLEKKQKYINLCKELDDHDTALKSFEQRRSSLESLIKLFLSAYYATPNLPKETPAGKRILEIREKNNEEKSSSKSKVRRRKVTNG